jgi:peptide/nickel transport system permease protein
VTAPRLALLLALAHVPIVGAAWCAPHGPAVQYREVARAGPGLRHPLGTDDLGRDVLSRVLHGARASLTAAAIGTGLALGLALALGTIAAVAGGALDAAVRSFADASMAVPWVFLLLAVRSALPLDLPPPVVLISVAALVGVLGWGVPARLVRAVVQDTRRRDHVQAARAAGASTWHEMTRHVWPAAQAVLTAQATILFPQFVMAEVVLSFLGLGMPESTPSLGTLIGELRALDVTTGQPFRLSPLVMLVVLLMGYNGVARRLVRPVAVTSVG